MQMPEPNLLILLGTAIVSVLFCIALRNALLQVKEENRTINASLIWLLLIPGVSLIMNFIVFFQLSRSIRNELEDRNYETDENPGLYLGLGYACSACLVYLIYVPISFTIIGFIALAGLVCFVQYWMKINWYRKVLEEDKSEEVEYLEDDSDESN